MKAMQPVDDWALRSNQCISTNYRFYGLSVTVRAVESEFNKNIIDKLDKIYSHFIAEGGEADLIVDLSAQRKNIIASLRSGLNSFGIDGWPIASLISSSSDSGSVYKIKGGPGFYELLRSSYYTILAFVLANLDGFLQIHAGAIAMGKAGIVIPGGSGSGKTTLALSLVNSGHRFLSDEICLIEPSDLTIYPFPRSLFLRDDVMHLFGDLKAGYYSGDIFVMREKKCLVEVADSSVYHENSSAHINLILFPSYHPGSKTQIKDVLETEALTRLISTGSILNMSHPGIDHGNILDRVLELVDSVPCLELTYSHTEDAVRAISRVLGP